MQHMYFCYSICIEAKGIYQHIQTLKILLDLLNDLVGLSCRALRTLLHSFQSMIDSIFPKGFFELLTLHSRETENMTSSIISLFCVPGSNIFSLIISFRLPGSHNSVIRAYQGTATFDKDCSFLNSAINNSLPHSFLDTGVCLL